MKRIMIFVAVVALVAASGWLSAEYVAKVHSAGPHKMVVESGGEIEILSGGTLDIQAGATTDFSSGIDLDGGTVTLDADADTTIVEASDDVISMTLGAATGLWNILTGNLKIGNGTPDVTQTGEDAYVEGTLEVDGLATLDGGIDLNAGGLAIDADADSIIDEVSDDVISMTLGAAAGYWNVLLGNSKVGNGTPDVSLNGEDAYVEGTFEVDGASRLDGTLTVNGAVTAAAGFTSSTTTALTGAVTVSNDLTVAGDSTGGNAGARNQITGLPKLALVAAGTMTNGTTETISYMDDTPDGEWTAIDADVTVTADAVRYRVGTKSLGLAFADTAADDDGAIIDIANDDLEANESIGFWLYSDTALDAGDLDILIDDTDAAPDQSYNVPAVAANVWTWVEVDISALAAGTGNVVDKVAVVLKDAAGLGAFNVYLDAMYKWDADDEEALGVALVQDGVLSVMSIVTHENQPNTPSILAEHTGYFTHYESGNDFIVSLADNSASSGVVMVAFQ